MALADDYSVVEEAIFLTLSQTTQVYQAIADFLAEGRDRGRWTPLPSIRDHLQKNGLTDADTEKVRGYLKNMGDWGLVLSDVDSSGIRSLKELHHARIRYQLSPKGSIALRFRDEVRNPESGSLADHRPAKILDGLIDLQHWIRRNAATPEPGHEALKELVALWSTINDTVAGMLTDADRFLSMLEPRIRDLAKTAEVEEGQTHPLIMFRKWIEEYTSSFINQVQRLKTFGGECIAQITTGEYSRPDGSTVVGERILRDALIKAENEIRGDLVTTSPPEAEADRIIDRLKVLVSADGACQVLIVRSHAALDRYLAAVKRIRIRTGAFAGTTRAQMYSALAAKVAHLDDLTALNIASVVLPERSTTRILDLAEFPHAKPGRDPWTHPPDWKLPLSPTRKGNPNFQRTTPIRESGPERIEALRRRAEMERREAAFWKRILSDGNIGIATLDLTLEESLWFTRNLTSAFSSVDRRFRLKDGTVVAIRWSDADDDVSRLRVREAGERTSAAFSLEVVR